MLRSWQGAARGAARGAGSLGSAPRHGAEGTAGGTRCREEKRAGPPLPHLHPPSICRMSAGGSSTEHTRQGMGMESCQGTSRPSLHLQPPQGPAAALGKGCCSGKGAHGTRGGHQPLLPPLLGRTPRSQNGRQSPGGGKLKALKASQGRLRNAGQGAGRGHGTRQHDTEPGPRLRRAVCRSPAGKRGGKPVLGAGTQEEHVQPRREPGRQRRGQVLPCSLAHPAGTPGAEPSSRRTGLPRSCPQPRARTTAALTPAERREKREQGKEATVRNTASRTPSQFFRPFWHQNDVS